MFQGVSENPLLGLTRNANKGVKVIQTERGPIAPRPGLILQWAGEVRREERPFLADILPDRRFDGTHRSVFAGLFSVAILFPRLLK